jgi:hypothetical protein
MVGVGTKQVAGDRVDHIAARENGAGGFADGGDGERARERQRAAADGGPILLATSLAPILSAI